MRLGPGNVDLANRLRLQVQAETELIDDGEGVAMVLLWTFLLDHAKAKGHDVETLAREQLEAFIEYARENLSLQRAH